MTMGWIYGDQRVTNCEYDVEAKDGTSAECPASFRVQTLELLAEKGIKWILSLITFNIVIIYYLCTWVNSTNSLALRAYTNTVVFNVLSLVVCLISIWVARNTPIDPKDAPSAKKPLVNHSRSLSATGHPEYNRSFATQLPRHSISGSCATENVEDPENETSVENPLSLAVFGLEKYEVLALLVSSCLVLMAGSLIAIEALTRIAEQPIIHTGRLGLGALLGLLAHLGTIWGHKDAGLDHVVCKALPCPTLRGYNPISGGKFLSAVILCGTHVLIHYWEIYIADTAAAVAVIGLTVTSMLPLAFYTASIILQKLPHHMGEQLDKCLREALNIDGVIEFRNERFWTQSFGKLAGTVQVRIRRDADENHVLERVVSRLSRIVSTLAVQEFRETQRNNFKSDYCPEYYINELLPNSGETKTAKDPKVNTDNVETMKIEDILGFERSPAGIFSAAANKFENKTRLQNCIDNHRTMTIYQNNNVRIKNYLFNESSENALLIGTKLNLKRLNEIRSQV